MQTIYDAKILIVDDNQDLLNLVTTALRSTGYNQLTACTGCAAAQAAFAANRPDLMILDINLPDGDGFRSEERRVGKECLRLCRSRWSPYH